MVVQHNKIYSPVAWVFVFLTIKKEIEMIKVYTTNQCPYCNMVKKFLTMKGKEYEVINVEDDLEARQSLFKKTGAMTVPITQVGEKFIIGWNPAKLGALI
jgi:glutaredoxin-like YruB-family protein